MALTPIIAEGGSGVGIRNEVNALNEIANLVVLPEKYGAVHTADDTTAIMDAFDLISAGGLIRFTAGTYTLSEPLLLTSNISVEICAGATLVAASGFSGTALIQIGTTSAFSSYNRIYGGGILNCGGNCDVGIDVKEGNFGYIEDLRINGAVKSGIVFGDTANASACYEMNASRVKIFNRDFTNNSASIGISYPYCTDSHMNTAEVIGYRIGCQVGANSNSIILYGVHPWGRPAHGAMLRAFDLQGRATLTNCAADTPYDLLGLGGDLYAFFLHGFNSSLTDCEVFMNTSYPGTDISTDNRIHCFYADRETYSAIKGIVIRGGTTGTKRFKSIFGGAASTYFDQTFRSGIQTPGAGWIADNSNSQENVPAAYPRQWRGIQYFNATVSYYDTVNYNKDMIRNGLAGVERGFTFQTSFSNRWSIKASSAAESGSNVGSAMLVYSYDDSGAQLKTLVNADRRGGWLMPTGFGMTALTAIPSYYAAGMMFLADRVTWDPLARGSGGAYWVWYTGSAWRGLHEDAAGTDLT